MNNVSTDAQRKGSKSRVLIEEKIASILIDSYYLPYKQSENGAFFIDNFHFAANIKILGDKLGINPNSLNKDFRHHKINCIQRISKNKIPSLLNENGWNIYQHSNQIFSLENVLKGNIKISTKWEAKSTNRTNKKDKLKQPNGCQEKKIITKNKTIIEENSTYNKLISKIPNQKSSNITEPFSEEEETYMFFLT